MSDNKIRISATTTTPEIVIDYDEKYVKISGKSVPEDAYDFYFIITQKLKNIEDLTLEIYFEFINSASLRFLVFAITSEYNLKKVEWYFDEEDTDMEEKAKMIKDIMNREKPEIEFNVIEKI